MKTAPLERQLLVAEYHNLSRILTDAGLEIPDLTIEELTDQELAAVVRRFRQMARTPR